MIRFGNILKKILTQRNFFDFSIVNFRNEIVFRDVRTNGEIEFILRFVFRTKNKKQNEKYFDSIFKTSSRRVFQRFDLEKRRKQSVFLLSSFPIVSKRLRSILFDKSSILDEILKNPTSSKFELKKKNVVSFRFEFFLLDDR